MARYSFDITGLGAMEKRAQKNKAATLSGGLMTDLTSLRRGSGASSFSSTSFRLSGPRLSQA